MASCENFVLVFTITNPLALPANFRKYRCAWLHTREGQNHLQVPTLLLQLCKTKPLLRFLLYGSDSESSARREFGSVGCWHFFYRSNPEGSAREQEGGACMPKSGKASKLRGGNQVDSGTPPGGRSSSYNPRRTAPLIRLPNHESQTAQGRGKFHQKSHGLPILLIRSPSRSISIAREW